MGTVSARGTMRCISLSCVYFNLSLLVLLIFLFFLLPSLRCKVACLVACSFLHLFVCLLSFQIASVTCGDFMKGCVILGYWLDRGAGLRERDRSQSAIWQHSEERERGCFLRIENQLASSRHRDQISRSELPNWHYFVCNLLILKGVGFKIGLFS